MTDTKPLADRLKARGQAMCYESPALGVVVSPMAGAVVGALGNCEHCGGAIQGHPARFCRSKCRSAYHAHREPEGRVTSVRTLANGRVRVIVYFNPGETSHLLKREFLPGQDVKLISAKDEEI